MNPDSDEIASAIRERILAGRLPPDERPPDALPAGAVLPAYRSLADLHGVAKQTIQNAFEQLASEGLVFTAQGRRARVANESPVEIIRYDRFRRSLREQPDRSTTFERRMRDAGWEPRVEYVHVGWARPPAWAAELLGVAPIDEVVERRRVRHAAPIINGKPDMVLERIVELFDTYYVGWVGRRAPAVATMAKAGVGGTYSRIEHEGEVPIQWIEERVSMRHPTQAEADVLGLKLGAWVIEVVRIVESEGRPIGVDREVRRPGHTQYVFRARHTD